MNEKDESSSNEEFIGIIDLPTPTQNENRRIYMVRTLISNRLRNQNWSQFMQISGQWKLTKICSMTTTYREYEIFSKLPRFPLLQQILEPKKNPSYAATADQISCYCKFLGVNNPQAEAISKVVNTHSGFVLIQGPPGTGK